MKPVCMHCGSTNLGRRPVEKGFVCHRCGCFTGGKDLYQREAKDLVPWSAEPTTTLPELKLEVSPPKSSVKTWEEFYPRSDVSRKVVPARIGESGVPSLSYSDPLVGRLYTGNRVLAETEFRPVYLQQGDELTVTWKIHVGGI